MAKKTKDFLKNLDKGKLTEKAKKDNGYDEKNKKIKQSWLDEHKNTKNKELKKEINFAINSRKFKHKKEK